MSKPQNIGEIISFIKNDVTELINLKLQFFKLEAVEKGSRGASFLIYGMALIGLVCVALLFGFLALGFLFADWLNSLAGGFALVVALYVVLIIVLLLLRKQIVNGVMNLFIKEMAPELNEEHNTKEEKRRKEGIYGCQ